MGDTGDQQQEQLDAAEQVVNAVRGVQGTSLEPVADQLGQDWPELSYALGRLCGEFAATYPETWQEPRDPGSVD